MWGLGTLTGAVKYWGEVCLFLGLMLGASFLNQAETSLIGVSLLMELDGLSWAMVLLSIWVMIMCLVGSMKLKDSSGFKSSFVCLSVFLLFFLTLSFSVSDLLFFYVGFECCLIPVFFMIVGWGYQPERAQAGIYLVFYTLLGSFPLFVLILSGLVSSGSSYMYHNTGFLVNNSLGLFCMVSAWFHLWLLKAHVEAPVAGSMVLAGVLLKLGGYGLMRILSFWSGGVSFIFECLIVFSLWGGLMVSLSCLRQMDMKLLIASSSVVHMSMCVSGLMVMSDWGYKSCLMMMVAHGLCSSGLFYLANLVYERTGSRSLLISKGLASLMPSMSLWWFLLSAANMAAPPSLNLISEVGFIMALLSWDFNLMLLLCGLSFFSGAYSLYLFSLSQHGLFLKSKSSFISGYLLEYLVCVLHWLPINLVVLSCWVFS
nr:NADH dehydrogenase subunit 4 [Eusirus cf. giganteus clade g2]